MSHTKKKITGQQDFEIFNTSGRRDIVVMETMRQPFIL